MADAYRRATDEEKKDYCSEDYDLLLGPDGFKTFLGEPEDCKWWRDGKEVVAKLNEQHAELDAICGRIAEVREITERYCHPIRRKALLDACRFIEGNTRVPLGRGLDKGR